MSTKITNTKIMEVIGSIIKLSFVFIIIEASVITENSSKKYKTESNDQFTNKDIMNIEKYFPLLMWIMMAISPIRNLTILLNYL